MSSGAGAVLAIALIALGGVAIWAGWSGNYAHLLTWAQLQPTTTTASKGN